MKKFGRLLDPGTENDPAPAGDPEPKAGDPAKDPENKPAADPEKYVPLDKHKDEVKKRREAEAELEKYRKAEEDRKKADMTEQERLKVERDEALSKATTLEISQAKTDALDDAMLQIGEGFHIPDDVLPRLKNAVKKLSYDPETLKQDVADLVQGMKRPKGSGGSVNKTTPKAGSTPDLKTFRPPSIDEAFESSGA